MRLREAYRRILEGTVKIHAPRDMVWHFLTDPKAVAVCAPGVSILHTLDAGKMFKASVTAGFSTIQATFQTDVEFVELKPLSHAKFRAHGVSPSGAVDVTSEMDLIELPAFATEMRWTADVVVVGKLVSLAAGRMDMVTRQMTDEFFVRMQTRLEVLGSRLA